MSELGAFVAIPEARIEGPDRGRQWSGLKWPVPAVLVAGKVQGIHCSATHRKMVQNLRWVAGHSVFAISLAAGVPAPWGIVLTSAVGAVLMPASKVVVPIDAQLLKGVKP